MWPGQWKIDLCRTEISFEEVGEARIGLVRWGHCVEESPECWSEEFGHCPVNKQRINKVFWERNNTLEVVPSEELILQWSIGWIKGKRTLKQGKRSIAVRQVWGDEVLDQGGNRAWKTSHETGKQQDSVTDWCSPCVFLPLLQITSFRRRKRLWGQVYLTGAFLKLLLNSWKSYCEVRWLQWPCGRISPLLYCQRGWKVMF